MLKVNVYSEKGVKKANVQLPRALYTKPNLRLLAQTIRVYQDNIHTGSAKVKSRAEVKISKRKIYRQKGTGHARHGAKSAPIFVGGGIAHGPRGLKRVLRLSKKQAKLALRTAFAIKAEEGKLLFIDNLDRLKKTKDTLNLIGKIFEHSKDLNKETKITFVISEDNKNVAKALRNIENLKVVSYKNLNAYKVYLGGWLFVDKKVIGDKKLAFEKDKDEKTSKTRVSKKSNAKLQLGKGNADKKKLQKILEKAKE